MGWRNPTPRENRINNLRASIARKRYDLASSENQRDRLNIKIPLLVEDIVRYTRELKILLEGESKE